MKNKDFETAVENLQDLFQALSKRNALTQLEVDVFNRSQRNIIAFYNFINGTAQVQMPWTDERFTEKWSMWKLYRKQEHGFKFKSPISEQSQLTRLSKLSGGDMFKAIELIQYAIDNTWQGIFPIKEHSKPKHQMPKASQVYRENIVNRVMKL